MTDPKSDVPGKFSDTRAQDTGGPLLLGLQLANQNNNNNGTLEVIPKSTLLEFRPMSGRFSDGAQDIDGPVFAGLFLANQNNSPVNQNNGGAGTLEVEPQSIIRERRLMSGLVKDNVGGAYNDTSLPRVYSSAQRSAGLTGSQLNFWKRNGFLVIEDALNQQAISAMVTEVQQVVEKILDKSSPERVCHVVASSGAHFTPNGRLLASLTPESPGPILSPLQRIQRIGNGVHRLLPHFRSATFSAANQQIAHSLGFCDPRVTQSLIVTKAARSGAKVVPHQDGCCNFVRQEKADAPGAVTFWYALQDATTHNGCLMVVPGSHRTEPLRRRCRVDERSLPQFVPVEPPVYYGGVAEEEPKKIAHGMHEFEKLEVKAGTLVLMHGSLLHASEANLSGNNRIAFNFSVVEGTLPWPADSYLRPYDGETEFEKLEPKTQKQVYDGISNAKKNRSYRTARL